MVMPTLINRIFKRKITIHTIGDSHAKIPWENIRIKDFEINTNRLGPRLMFTVGENPDIISLKNFKIKKKDIIIFCFGEIDCRCHVWKHKNRGYKTVIDSLVKNYISSIILATKKVNKTKVFIHSVVPAIRKEQHLNNEVPELPFLGNDKTRKSYVLYMNRVLKNSCAMNGFNFFDIYDFYTDSDGYLDYELSDKNVHIGNHKYIEKYIINTIIPLLKK